MIIVATANKGKFEEIRQYLAGTFTTFFSLADFDEKVEVVEDQPTYYENAWKKARKVGNRFGIATLADDSGLEVEALQGRPGICSAGTERTIGRGWTGFSGSWAGCPLKGARPFSRLTSSIISLTWDRPLCFMGASRDISALRGEGRRGSATIPYSCCPDSGKALSELSLEEKNSISHRGRALARFKKFLSA